MKKKFIATVCLFATFHAFSQNVGIGTNTPDASAKLDIEDANRGILIPRVALSSTGVAAPVTSPAVGLLVFNTTTAGNVTPGFYYWDGTQWSRIQNGQGNDWTLTGNAGTTPTTNFIGTTDNQPLSVKTNNTEQMRVLTNGNVGIGTSTPGYRLDLANGTFAFGNSNVRTETRNDAGLQGNAGAQSGFFETSAPTNFPTGATSWWHLLDVRHSNNTNNYALQISGSFFDQELWFRKTNGSAVTPWSRLLSTSNFNTYAWSTNGNAGTNPTNNFVGTTDNQALSFRTNNTEYMRILTNGNVGVGTATPGNKLTVNGTIQALDIFAAGGQNLLVGDDTYFSDVDLANALGLYSTSNSFSHLLLGSSNRGMLTGGTPIYVHSSGSQTFGSGGRYMFAASQSVTGQTSGETGGIYADGNTVSIWSPGDANQGQPAALVYFMDEDRWDGNGNPYDNNALLSYINTAGALVSASDMRRKNNITPISNSLSRILQIKGYEYYFNLVQEEIEKGDVAPLQSGVIAQEIKEFFPTAVEESTTGDLYVNYSALTPYLIESIKEQQLMIEEQHRLIEEMQREIESLKKQN